MRSSRMDEFQPSWMRSNRAGMISSQVVRASGCQCQSRNSPVVRSQHPPTQWIRRAADEAVLQNVTKKRKKFLLKNVNDDFSICLPFLSMKKLLISFSFSKTSRTGKVSYNILYSSISKRFYFPFRIFVFKTLDFPCILGSANIKICFVTKPIKGAK